MGLKHTDAVVIVYDEAGKAVSLAVNKAVAGGFPASGKAVRLTEFQGTGQHERPEIGPGGVLVKTEDADGDGANLVMAAGKELTIGRINAHHVSLCGMSDNLGDGPREHPGVEAEDGLLTAGFQNDFIHWLRFFPDAFPLQ